MDRDELFDAVMRVNGVPEALQELRYSSAVEVIDEVIAVNPAATVADIRQYAATRRAAVEAQIDEAEARKERAVCQHCQVAIVRGSDGTWYHGHSPSWGSRGCRAYSMHRLGTWDDTLDRLTAAVDAYLRSHGAAYPGFGTIIEIRWAKRVAP